MILSMKPSIYWQSTGVRNIDNESHCEELNLILKGMDSKRISVFMKFLLNLQNENSFQ